MVLGLHPCSLYISPSFSTVAQLNAEGAGSAATPQRREIVACALDRAEARLMDSRRQHRAEWQRPQAQRICGSQLKDRVAREG